MENSNKPTKDIFRFKQFSVVQGDVAMRVNTDGVLLGAFMANYILQQSICPSKILDIGSGTGVISLMLAQALSKKRNNFYEIDAIDIEQECFEISKLNFENSLWNRCLHSHHTSLQNFGTDKNSYDIIVSNPPFFHNSIKSKNMETAVAKHTISLTFDDLISKSCGLLKDSGSFCVIIPGDRMDDFLSLAQKFFLYPKEIVNIYSKETDIIENMGVKRVIILLSKGIQELSTSSHFLYTDNRATRSEWYRNLTKEYYLD